MILLKAFMIWINYRFFDYMKGDPHTSKSVWDFK